MVAAILRRARGLRVSRIPSPLAPPPIAWSLSRFSSTHASKAATEDQAEECGGLAEAREAVDVSFPTYMVWGSNTGVGKTLISAGEFLNSGVLIAWLGSVVVEFGATFGATFF